MAGRAPRVLPRIRRRVRALRPIARISGRAWMPFVQVMDLPVRSGTPGDVPGPGSVPACVVARSPHEQSRTADNLRRSDPRFWRSPVVAFPLERSCSCGIGPFCARLDIDTATQDRCADGFLWGRAGPTPPAGRRPRTARWRSLRPPNRGFPPLPWLSPEPPGQDK